jgi:hypothetical protein
MRSRKDHWFEMNPYAQRFINTCAVCGAQGYAPQIDDADFAGNGSTLIHRFSREKLQALLRKYYQPMALDETGRCDECARPVGGRRPISDVLPPSNATLTGPK